MVPPAVEAGHQQRRSEARDQHQYQDVPQPEALTSARSPPRPSRHNRIVRAGRKGRPDGAAQRFDRPRRWPVGSLLLAGLTVTLLLVFVIRSGRGRE
jgi:hypothetical protein